MTSTRMRGLVPTVLGLALVAAGCTGETGASPTTAPILEPPVTAAQPTIDSTAPPSPEWPVVTGEEFIPPPASGPVGGMPVGSPPSACIGCPVIALADGRPLVPRVGRADIFDPTTGVFEATGAPIGWYQDGGEGVLLDDGQVLLSGASVMRDEGVIYEEDGSHLELFDPTQGRFTQLDVATAFGAHPALLADGRVLLVGGREGGAVFDPGDESLVGTGFVRGLLGAWQRSHAESGLAAPLALGDGRVLIVGDEASLYDPATDSFEETSPRIHATLEPALAMMPDGRVLVAGGSSGWGGWDQNTREEIWSAKVEIFDPGTQTFQATGSMLEARQGHVTVTLHDGRVLILGGAGDTVEVFDPVTERFSALPAMSRPRHQPAVALLPDGTVLVVGGLDDGSGLDSTTSQSAEIYLAHDPTHPPIPPIREQPVLMVGLDVDFETRSPPDGFEITVPPGGFEGLSTGRVAWSGGSLQHHVFVAESDLSRIDLEIPACEDGCVIAGPLELSPRQFYMAGRSMYVVLELEYADRIPTEAGELTLTVTGGDGG